MATIAKSKTVYALLLLALLAVTAVAVGEPWNESTPAGTEDPTLGDDRIREFKRAIRERLAEEHHFESIETIPYGQLLSQIGRHKHLTLIEQSGWRATGDNENAIFAYNAGGATEIFFRGAADKDPFQVTGGGVSHIRNAALDPTISGKTLTSNTFSGTNTNSGTITGGSYSAPTISGGTRTGTVTNSATTTGGIFNNIQLGGTITGTYTLSNATATGGTYTAPTISGGTRTGTVTNSATYNGGTHNNVTLSGTTQNTGTIQGGTMSGVAIQGGSISGVNTTNQINSTSIVDGSIQAVDIGNQQIISRHMQNGMINSLPNKGYGGINDGFGTASASIDITAPSSYDGGNLGCLKFRVYIPVGAQKLSATIYVTGIGYARIYCGGLAGSSAAYNSSGGLYSWINLSSLDVSALSGWQDLWIQFQRGQSITQSVRAYSFAWVN